ncbi:hypothetical protein DSM104299_05405 [Baekduia alba]|uniref:hypothetical protein n=1 Tax=Baekduia alba TaxID=2997333 RepID=UPI002341DB18|nr:hypothetical protein [Baekduia alba]WCB96640.1 hypothetical protein DSM104299_05405 [Baekduia alba]
MSGDAFDRLEVQLRGAVVAHATAPVRPRSRPWRHVPRRGGLLAAAAALLVAGGGAVAATHVWKVGPPADDTKYLPKPSPDAGAGVAQGQARILALRVPDPLGGPPWALRIFGSTRGGSCVQVGQVVRGRFGRMQGEVLRPIAAVPGQNSLCGFVARNGYPVLRGLRTVQVTGGMGDPHQCGASACPVTAVRTIRYGLLGPSARSATYVDADGRRGPTTAIDGAGGGAYLFVLRSDPAPYEARDRRERGNQARMAAELRRLHKAGVTGPTALRRAMRDVLATGPRPAMTIGVPRIRDGVDATFAGGTTLRVAGHGRTGGPLPGVTRPSTTTTNKADVRAPLTVTRRGTVASARFTVRFRAPVAIMRADHHYTLTLTGLAGSRCDRPSPAGGQATTRNVARGEAVTFTVRRGLGSRDGETYCPGAHTLRVGYSSGSGPFAGRLVGSYAFTVPG